MTQITRRGLFAGIAALGVAGTLSSCGGGNGTSGASASGSAGASGGEKVELTLFHRWPNEPRNTYFENLVKDFQTANPNITVKTDKVINDTYKDKVRVTVGSAQAPDVFFSWSGSFATSLVATGNVMALDERLAAEPDFAKQFVANQLPPFQVEGKQVGLPIAMIGKVFFYNTKIFAENSIEPPKTWDELISACKRLKDANVTPIAYGSKDQWTIAHYVGTLNQRIVDAAIIASDYDPATGEFTDPGYVQALERFQELLPYMNENPNAIGHQQARDNWLAGDAAMMYLESGEFNYIEDQAFEWSTFNFPSVPGGKGDQEQLTGAPEGFMIANNTKHPEEAWALLKFLLSPEQGTKWTDETGDLTAIESAIADTKAPEPVKELAAQMAESSSMTPWLDNAIDPQLVSVYLTETQLMLGGEKSAADVMAQVQATADRLRG